MVKGVSARFVSYEETVPKFLRVIKFDQTLKGHSAIVLKPSLKNLRAHNTPVAFVDEVLKFCLVHKDPAASILVAEGSDGDETPDVFEHAGYKKLAEKYNISLVDLNTADTEELQNSDFLRFESIHYPKLLLNSFLITLPRLGPDDELEVQDSLTTMLGAFPSEHYRGLFSTLKNKIRRFPLKYAIHDILRCKMPNATLIDASDYGVLLAGKPLELDKEAMRIMGKDWRSLQHLRLIDESFAQTAALAAARATARAAKQAQQTQQPARTIQ